MIDGEYHVASFVVSTRPRHGTEVAAHINSLAGLEVHAEEHGKLIVTAEARHIRDLEALAASLEAIKYVIAVAPVYHEYAGAAESAAPISQTGKQVL